MEHVVFICVTRIFIGKMSSSCSIVHTVLLPLEALNGTNAS